jgi:hypothetical protein
MRIFAGIFAVTFSATLLFSADYVIKTVKVLPIESYPARTSLEGVTIAADPYSTNEKSFTAFDVKNLNTRGYFPIHIIVRNDSQSFIVVRTREIVLITPSGQKLYTTPATVVVEDVIEPGLMRNVPIIKSHDRATSTKTGSPLSDFTEKDITNRSVEPGTTSDGFLFFYTPYPKQNPFTGSSLLIPKLEEETTGRPLGPYKIPLDPALSVTGK